MEFINGDGKAFSTGLWPAAAAGSKEDPCVLKSSLQWGDHCSDNTEVLSVIVSKGLEVEVMLEALQMRMLPSGKLVPVASKSGFHGHQARA